MRNASNPPEQPVSRSERATTLATHTPSSAAMGKRITRMSGPTATSIMGMWANPVGL